MRWRQRWLRAIRRARTRTARPTCTVNGCANSGRTERIRRPRTSGLAEMYVADERFKAYYEAVAPGAAEFLRDAIKAYCA